MSHPPSPLFLSHPPSAYVLWSHPPSAYVLWSHPRSLYFLWSHPPSPPRSEKKGERIAVVVVSLLSLSLLISQRKPQLCDVERGDVGRLWIRRGKPPEWCRSVAR